MNAPYVLNLGGYHCLASDCRWHDRRGSPFGLDGLMGLLTNNRGLDQPVEDNSRTQKSRSKRIPEPPNLTWAMLAADRVGRPEQVIGVRSSYKQERKISWSRRTIPRALLLICGS